MRTCAGWPLSSAFLPSRARVAFTVMSRSTIPLRHRLPNASPLFTGRKEEGAALAAAVRRARVVVLWGLGGAGKSTLVLKTLQKRFARRVPRTLFVALRPGVTAPDVEVARVLGQTGGGNRGAIDWPGLDAGSEALATAVIDLAESGPWWIVLEDLQHADADRVRAFLEFFGRYARDARIIATSRVDPGLDTAAGIALPLGGMSEADLTRMARRARPKLTTSGARDAARAAAGSPWRLLQALSPGKVPESGRALTPEQEAFLLRLAMVQVPVPRATLEAFAPPPEPVESMVRRGLLESSGAGVRVHDVVRGMLPSWSGLERDGAHVAAGRALLDADDPAAILEGARLLVHAGRLSEAAGIAAKADRLLADGFGPALWELIGGIHEPALESVRLRCAADIGSADAVARVREPSGTSLRDLLDWARVCRHAGDLKRAAEVAGEVQRRTTDPALAFEGGLLRCRCRIVLGAADEVLDDAQRLVAPGADDAARRDALVAQALTYVGRSEEAASMALALRASLARLSPTARVEVGVGIARVLYDATRLAEADAILESVLETLGPSAALRSHGRNALHLKTYIAQDRGKIAEVRALLKRRSSESFVLRASARAVDATLRVATGELAGLEDFLVTSIEDAERMGNRNYRDMADGMRVRLASILGKRAAASPPGEGETPDPTIRALRSLWSFQNAQRHREAPSRDAFPDPATLAGNIELRVLARSVWAEWSLLQGDAASARADAGIAVKWAEDAGLALAESEALLVFADVLSVEGRQDDLEQVLDRLDALAASLPSPRLRDETRFHRAARAGDPSALEVLAGSKAGPAAARRARALLGERVPLDAIDALLVEAIRRLPEWRVVETLARPPLASGLSGWGIDESRAAVWLGDGRTVPFAKKPLSFRILAALAGRGGAATKEELVRAVWSEVEYHPLHHDNRLQLAILKLRRAIENDPARPELLVATPEGYALRAPVRRRRAQ